MQNETVSDPKNENIHYKGIVLWTDGGARPNPGSIGWGAHGYQYTTEPSKTGPGLSTHILTTEGYLPAREKGKTDKPIVTPQKYYDFYGSSSVIASNNAAEVDALYFSLEKVKNEEGLKKVQIYTDSEYLRRGITEWVNIWEKRGWVKEDGRPVSNADNWKRLVKEKNELEERGIDFKINWVKGHRDNFGNILADRLATIGVMHSMNESVRHEYKTSPAQGYWKTDVEKHPFINFKRIYFNSCPTYNVDGAYLLSEPGVEDEFFCKRVPDAAFAVVRLKEPEPVLEMIKRHQYDISQGINSMMVVRADKVFTPQVYDVLEEHGKYALSPSFKRTMGIDFIDATPITIEMRPAGLSLRSIEIFSFLDEVLNKFKSQREGTAEATYTSFTIHDVTNHFFEREEKLKKKEITVTHKLKSNFVVGFKDLMVEVSINHGDALRAVNIPLVLGLDLPNRNSLKRMEEKNPRVYVVTWKESDQYLRYACILEMGDDVGIWSNYFADSIFLTS